MKLQNNLENSVQDLPDLTNYLSPSDITDGNESSETNEKIPVPENIQNCADELWLTVEIREVDWYWAQVMTITDPKTGYEKDIWIVISPSFNIDDAFYDALQKMYWLAVDETKTSTYTKMQGNREVEYKTNETPVYARGQLLGVRKIPANASQERITKDQIDFITNLGDDKKELLYTETSKKDKTENTESDLSKPAHDLKEWGRY